MFFYSIIQVLATPHLINQENISAPFVIPLSAEINGIWDYIMAKPHIRCDVISYLRPEQQVNKMVYVSVLLSHHSRRCALTGKKSMSSAPFPEKKKKNISFLGYSTNLATVQTLPQNYKNELKLTPRNYE